MLDSFYQPQDENTTQDFSPDYHDWAETFARINEARNENLRDLENKTGVQMWLQKSLNENNILGGSKQWRAWGSQVPTGMGNEAAKAYGGGAFIGSPGINGAPRNTWDAHDLQGVISREPYLRNALDDNMINWAQRESGGQGRNSYTLLQGGRGGSIGPNGPLDDAPKPPSGVKTGSPFPVYNNGDFRTQGEYGTPYEHTLFTGHRPVNSPPSNVPPEMGVDHSTGGWVEDDQLGQFMKPRAGSMDRGPMGQEQRSPGDWKYVQNLKDDQGDALFSPEDLRDMRRAGGKKFEQEFPETGGRYLDTRRFEAPAEMPAANQSQSNQSQKGVYQIPGGYSSSDYMKHANDVLNEFNKGASSDSGDMPFWEKPMSPFGRKRQEDQARAAASRGAAPSPTMAHEASRPAAGATHELADGRIVDIYGRILRDPRSLQQRLAQEMQAREYRKNMTPQDSPFRYSPYGY